MFIYKKDEYISEMCVLSLNEFHNLIKMRLNLIKFEEKYCVNLLITIKRLCFWK